MVLEEKKVKLPKTDFPALWQAVLYRNYGFVAKERLAEVLGTDVKTVEAEAERLELGNIVYNSQWIKSGYITIIKNNWFLLNYEQLMQLLGWEEEKLDYVIKEEDFLYVKLGNFKPYCERVQYYPLDEAEKAETKKIAAILNGQGQEESEAFDFFSTKSAVTTAHGEEEGRRIIHGYITPCIDVFATDSHSYLPDELLCRYASVGANGLWFHAMLSELSPYPFKNLGDGYKARRKNLQEIVERCKKYGIKVFLYFNEPRCMRTEDFKGQEEIKGTDSGIFSALCMGTEKVREYLYEAVFSLFSQVKGIGGIMTITMSENLTHCHSLRVGNCPRCKDTPPYEEAALVNNIIQKALKDSKSGAELIANLWGWSEFSGWTREEIFKGIDLLDQEISVLCNSEYGLAIEKGGVGSKVIDYSLSNPGPSAESKELLTKAKEAGHKTYAKIQVNNSWECSSVPYFPVFDLVYEHLSNLRQLGVYNYMLSWTLGGWPSLSLDLTNAFGKGEDLDEWYCKTFGENASAIREAVRLLCYGFKNYPFSLSGLYDSPKNHGYANLWHFEREEIPSMMVSFSFDDYEQWLGPYPYEVYVSQMKKLLTETERGIALLERYKSEEKVFEIWLYASVVYLHFAADYEQTVFSFLKRDIRNYKKEIGEVLSRAEEGTKRLMALQKLDGKIGYEASNHYFYTTRNLKEKLLNLYRLKEKLNSL